MENLQLAAHVLGLVSVWRGLAPHALTREQASAASSDPPENRRLF
jgi:nitroreductase